ncbi:hypothetical protein O6H91_Y006400 [Diphasiastrum complanatum]|nr:hypothetical protein O6H91_Y006400 [Diphasiastrum complanatum]
MIGQQKRPLEVAVSPLSVKYIKHTDFSRYKEANDCLKPDADIVKDGLDLGTCAQTELKQQLSLDEFQCHEEAKRSLMLVPSSLYHEGSSLSKQQALAKPKSTPERKEVPAQSSSCPQVQPSQLQGSPSPSKHRLDQTEEYCTTANPELLDEVFHPHFSKGHILPHKKVSIGPDFQAHVPVWEVKLAPVVTLGSAGPAQGRTKSKDKSDERWLGAQVWPLPGCRKQESSSKVGKGRIGTCSCIYSGSIECIQKHVREEMMRLKLEVGEAFELWGFNEMGENVSKRWTEEEKTRFKMLVKMNTVSLGRNFWHTLPFAFPTRSTKEFVSYYFNAFVLHRRAIQNRLDPKNIDSDDDEGDLTGSDGDEYDTDEESEFEQDESDEDEAENDWERNTESKQEQVLKASSLFDFKHTNGHCSFEGECLGDDVSAKLLPLTRSTMADQNSLDESMQNSSSLPILDWNHDSQMVGKHFQLSNHFTGADDFQGDWDDGQWQQSHIPDRDVRSKLRSPCELEMSPYVKESYYGKDYPSLVQRSSLETCGTELWVGYLDIVPRKNMDKLISTTRLITELFGDGTTREADEGKFSGNCYRT